MPDTYGLRLWTYRRHRPLLFVLLLLLLLTAFLRIRHLVDFVEWPDEIYTVWQAKMNMQDGLIHFDPYWPPLYTLIVWVWMQIVGLALEAQRYLSVLFSLLSVAFTYRAALSLYRFRLDSSTRANDAPPYIPSLIAGLVVAVTGYSVFAGVDVRGYGLLLMLLPLTLWMMLRWLNRPSWQHGLVVAICIGLLLNVSFSSLILIPFLTLFLIITRPRLFFGWAAIGVVVLITVLPIAPQFFQNNILGRLTPVQNMPEFTYAIPDILNEFGGSDWFVWVVVVAAILFVAQLLRNRTQWRQWVFLLLWMLFPVFIYVTVHSKDMWHPRYLWWVATGLALFIGYAAIRLPRYVAVGAVVVLLVAAAQPTDFFIYRLAVTTSPPFRMVLSWLAKNIQPDDVIVIDPKCACGKETGWNYFIPQYFPTGVLPIVADPGTASRVWYLSTAKWGQDPALLDKIQENRKESIFVGPWYFLMRLYEGPPSWDGITFGDKITFNGVRLENGIPVVSDNTIVNLKLWWSVKQPVDRDYSISVALIDKDGRLIAQNDGPPKSPADTPSQTSAWQVGKYYEDERTLQIPKIPDGGRYRLVISIYQWWDGVRLTPKTIAQTSEKLDSQWRRTGQDGNYLLISPLLVGSPW